MEITAWGSRFYLGQAYEDDCYVKFIQYPLSKNGLVCKTPADQQEAIWDLEGMKKLAVQAFLTQTVGFFLIILHVVGST